MRFKAIIFDMDGVLFDTEQFYYNRRKTFLASKGISIDHIPPSFFVGGNMKQVWQTILGVDYANWDIQRLQEAYEHYKEMNPLPYKDLIFPDVHHVLEQLSQFGLQIGLASSSTKSDILRALEETNLTSYFDLVLSGEEFPETKPHPAIYNKAAHQLGLDKETILVIEDSEKGIKAAFSAGIEVWAIRDTIFDLDQSKARYLVNNLTEALTTLFLEGVRQDFR